MKRHLISLVVVASMFTGAGCAGRTAEWEKGGESPAPAQADTAAATSDMEIANAAWAQRSDPAKIQEAIAAWEKVADKDPKNLEALVMLTRAHYFWGDGFLRDDEEKYLEVLDKGVKWGEKALVVASPEFAEAMKNKGKFHEAIKKIGPEAVPAAYWYASSLGKWAKRKSFAVLLGQKDNIRATMERVMELDEGYYYAGPHRYFGAMYAIAPGFAGGDMELSIKHYNIAIEKQPNFLGTKVLQAENYATKEDDEEMFTKLLEEVLAGDPKAIPEIEPEMIVEQEKAKELLAKKDDLF